MNRRARRQASQKASVQRLILGAQGGAQMLHQVTKPSLWRGGASLFLTPEKDAAEGTGICVKFHGWRVHWQESEKHQEQHRAKEAGEGFIAFEVMAATRAAALRTVRIESFRRSLGPVLRENSDLHS